MLPLTGGHSAFLCMKWWPANLHLRQTAKTIFLSRFFTTTFCIPCGWQRKQFPYWKGWANAFIISLSAILYGVFLHPAIQFSMNIVWKDARNMMNVVLQVPSVLWCCWFGSRKGIWPVKIWVVGYWRGYLSGARCRLACGPADATATVKSRLVLPLWYRLTRVVPDKAPLNVCVCVCVCVCGLVQITCSCEPAVWCQHPWSLVCLSGSKIWVPLTTLNHQNVLTKRMLNL